MSESISRKSENNREEDICSKMQQFVRERLIQHDLELMTVTAIDPLPPGENYTSRIIKLCVSVRKKGGHKNEALALIAKMGKKCENSFVDWPKSFEKESFMYTDLLPAYRDIEREAGVEEKDLIDILPRYFGARGNIEEITEVTDDNLILLMENLKHKGFNTVNSDVGVNMEQATKALSTLARYHAMGIAMKQKRPLLAARAIKNARLQCVRSTIFDSTFVGVCETFRNCPRLAEYEKTLKSSLESYKKVLYTETFEPEEPWATITHGDLWLNNMLFCKDQDRKGKIIVTDVKFIAFQLSLHASPLMDLPYFFCTSLGGDIIDNNYYEDLLQTYYHSFIQTLDSVACDTRLFSKHSFNSELRKQAKVVFAMCAIASKFLAFDMDNVKDHDDFQECIAKFGTTDAFIQRLIKVVEIYERNNWFL